jgi:hypothetical protein
MNDACEHAVVWSRKLPFDAEPKTHGLFDFGELIWSKSSEATKKLGVGNSDDSLSVKGTRLQETDSDRTLELRRAHRRCMWDECSQCSVRVCGRNAQNQARTNLGG